MIASLYTLAWMTRPLMQEVEAAVEHGLASSGLTVRQRAVMEILSHQGPLPVPALAEALHIQRQYVQVMVNETLAAGLVEKRPNPRHARSALITLTEAGRILIDTVTAQEHALLTEIAGDLPSQDVEIALKVMQELHARFHSYNQGPSS
ncbi:MarR family winged helix-turn-helix transcriptional regulator [Thalassobius sp. MITS945101]|uniref:MarR family winged helix-turn-helix transcriptional regulator n=1 Tax=Thalassobius sp. MITS945101 TaxID=3096994 RepID=UPI00399B84F2